MIGQVSLWMKHGEALYDPRSMMLQYPKVIAIAAVIHLQLTYEMTVNLRILEKFRLNKPRVKIIIWACIKLELQLHSSIVDASIPLL
jgi:hypothetical protein